MSKRYIWVGGCPQGFALAAPTYTLENAPDPPIALGLNILRAPDDHTQSRRSRSTAPRATATADPPQHLIRVPHHPHHQYDWRPGRQWWVPPPTAPAPSAAAAYAPSCPSAPRADDGKRGGLAPARFFRKRKSGFFVGVLWARRRCVFPGVCWLVSRS